MKHLFVKTINGLMPDNQVTDDWFSKQKIGALISGEFKKKNNPDFHRKLMKMIGLAFEYWEPAHIECKFGTPTKNFERFRKDLTIRAGYYELHARLDGSYRVEAQSISFDKMSHDERKQFYSDVLDVILQEIMIDKTKEDFQKLLDFA